MIKSAFTVLDRLGRLAVVLTQTLLKLLIMKVRIIQENIFKEKKTLNKKMYRIKDGAIFSYRVMETDYENYSLVTVNGLWI